MLSAQKAKNLSILNIGKQNAYPYDAILRYAKQGKTKLFIPTDMLSKPERKSLIKNGYKLTDNEIGETEISWDNE